MTAPTHPQARPITQTIALPLDVSGALMLPALARGLSAGALALRIVETVVEAELIGAVLDDGVPEVSFAPAPAPPKSIGGGR